MERVTHSRFKDAPWYSINPEYVIIGGAGGIGSWTAFLLARSGFHPVVHDFDILEIHNLGGQLYPKSKVGSHKVNALREIITDYSDTVIDINTERITKDSPTHHFAISAFDNMQARKDMFKKWYDTFGSDPKAIFIDGRLNAEHMQIFCVRGGETDTIKEKQQIYFNEHLFDDSEVEDAPCTLKQTSHAAAMIGSHIVGFFTNHITNVVENEETRNVPFKWEYFIPIDLLDVQS